MCSLPQIQGFVTSRVPMNDNTRTVTDGCVFLIYKYTWGCHLPSQRESSEHLTQRERESHQSLFIVPPFVNSFKAIFVTHHLTSITFPDFTFY